MEYRHTKTIEDSKFIIRVYQPILTEDERKRRMKAIYDAAARLLKEVHKR